MDGSCGAARNVWSEGTYVSSSTRCTLVRALRRPAGGLLFAVIAGALLVACSSGSSTSASSTIPPVQVRGSTPAAPGASGPGGAGVVGESELPGFPSDFPKSVTLPNNYVLVSSLSSNKKTSSGWHISAAIPGTVSSAFAAYKKKLTSAGYSVTITNTSSTSETLKASNSTWTITAVAPEPTFSVTVGIPPGDIVAGITIS